MNKLTGLSGLALAAALFGGIALASHANAEPLPTIDLTTVEADGAKYPDCVEEDCSDQPNQVGVWTDKSGDAYLIKGEQTWLIIDDTVTRT